MEASFNTETEKARLPTDSCENNSKRSSLVNCISTNPECRSDNRRLVYNHSLVLKLSVSVLVSPCLRRVCSPSPDPSQARHLHLVVECGIHGQKNTNPANLQCCGSTEAETGIVPTSAQFFAVSTFLILRSPS